MRNVLKLIIVFSLMPVLFVHPLNKAAKQGNYIRPSIPGKLLSRPDSNISLVGRWPYGACYAVKPTGNYALVGNGSALDIVDISNAQMPVKVSGIITPSVVEDICIKDNLAFAADGLYHLLLKAVIGIMDMKQLQCLLKEVMHFLLMVIMDYRFLI